MGHLVPTQPLGQESRNAPCGDGECCVTPPRAAAKETRDNGYIIGNALCGASLLTITAAISVDRLLAISLGLRYKQIVSLGRTYIIVATFWVISGAAAFCYILDPQILFWCSFIIPPPCLIISVVSYIMIFRVLRKDHAQVRDHLQQKLSQPTKAFNLVRFRKGRVRCTVRAVSIGCLFSII